jgi:hypothetical protein
MHNATESHEYCLDSTNDSANVTDLRTYSDEFYNSINVVEFMISRITTKWSKVFFIAEFVYRMKFFYHICLGCLSRYLAVCYAT